MEPPFEIFLTAPPGLEPLLADEARAAGFAAPVAGPGGVTVQGGWPEVWRANLDLRGAGRVLVRVATFRALHLAQLDKRARRVDWRALLPQGAALRVEAACHASRIYHAGAAAQRVARAAAEAVGGTEVRGPAARGAGDDDAAAGDGPAGDALRLFVRIDDDLCTISLDTSGAPLHRRGTKQAVGKAPLRETMAALFLRACGFDGTGPVVDPMCGSGTIPIEAAAIAAGLAPGRARGFAFEALPGFDPLAMAALRARAPVPRSGAVMHGGDRDAGAVRMALANAERAGVADRLRLGCAPVSALRPPEGGPGLVLVNPPYGARIGNRNLLFALYASLGAVLAGHFAGWRVGLITADAGLARATGLPWGPPGPPVPHGGLTVRLWQAGPLG
jgi:putative N6-adenine-specific DNA methylase